MLNHINERLSKISSVANLGQKATRDLHALDYMINKHPNKEQIFGVDYDDWQLNIPPNTMTQINDKLAAYNAYQKSAAYTDLVRQTLE